MHQNNSKHVIWSEMEGTLSNQPIDKNSLPCLSNLLRTEMYAKVMVLCSVVEEIMNNDKNHVWVYSNDGFGRSGVGNYIVQSLTINDVQRTLPTLPIVSKSKKTLKDHSIQTSKLLSAASGGKYQEQQLFEKISFSMTDSLALNLGVLQMVSEKLNSEHNSPNLLCNVHPLMMFQNKIKDLCQQIHDSIGKKRLHDCFMVDVEFTNKSFILKAQKCLSNFINKECSSKHWNWWDHFTEFIKPKENQLISFKDHHFNQLNYCCLTVLYHLDKIVRYLLKKYLSITNSILILNRSFIDTEILEHIFAVISLLSIHILRSFHKLMMDQSTNYSTLLEA